MSNQMVFESTESVIEILWDIALAIFVVRLAFGYVALSLAAFGLLFWSGHSFLMSWIEHLHLTSDVVTISVATSAIVLPLVCARTVIALSEVPRVTVFRLAIGGAALVMAALISLVGWLVMPASTVAVLHNKAVLLFGSNYTTHTVAAIGSLALASLFLMPLLSMVCLEDLASSKRPATDWTAPTEYADEKQALPSVAEENSPATKSTRKSHPMIPAN